MRHLVVGSVAIVLLATGGRAGVSQEIPEPSIGIAGVASKGTITGFAGLEWGANRLEVLSGKGAPSGTASAGAGAERLTWEGIRILGRPAGMAITIHPELGLVEGDYGIGYGMGRDCETTFDAVVGDISARYPDVQPTIKKTNDTALDLCSAIQIGRAEAMATWFEEWPNPSGNPIPPRAYIFVMVETDPGRVYISYSSPHAREWAEAAQAERRKAVW